MGEPSLLHAPTITSSEGSTTGVEEGFEEEFSAFYRSTFIRLVAYLIHLGAPNDLAAEIAQDAMLRTYRRWADIHDRRSFVFKIAGQSLVRAMVRVEEEVDQDPSGHGPSPAAGSELEEHAQQLEVLRTLQALPPRQRQVLALTLAGFSTREIAELLGVNPGVVRQMLVRARSKVTDSLTAQESNE